MKRLIIAIIAVAALGITSWLLLVSFGFFEGDLTGTVFIVTRGGQNVKLGLVEVRAIPGREIASFLQEKQAVADEQQEKLKPLMEEAEQQAQEAEDEYKNAVIKASKVVDEEKAASDKDILYLNNARIGEEGKILEAMEASRERMGAVIETQEATRDASEAKRHAWSKLKDKYSYWTSCTHYFDGLPVGVASTKTDADGAFSLRLRRGVKYALAAKARRDVMDDTEEYCWVVWVILDGSQTKIFLSNDNLFTPDSISSVVTATE